MQHLNLLETGLKKIGIQPNDQILNQFSLYYDLLIEWNNKFNLTAITDEQEVIKKHFLDSILITQFCDLSKINQCIDIGTGAGFPGIPLKIIYPNIKFTLVDSLEKRMTFLQEVIKALNLTGVEVRHSRAEDLSKNVEYREAYDLCVSRAVSHLSTLSEYCIPFVKRNGLFISYKAHDIEAEVEQSTNAINLLGGKVKMIKENEIDCIDTKRTYVLIEKIKTTPNQYPRKAGLPSKKPL